MPENSKRFTGESVMSRRFHFNIAREAATFSPDLPATDKIYLLY